MVQQTIKRDGRVESFEESKIRKALHNCLTSFEIEDKENKIDKVLNIVFSKIGDANTLHVEHIQDLVEEALMSAGLYEAAKAYILYRDKRSELRSKRLEPDQNAIADYIHPAKYARYIPELKRRETFKESITRVKNMHLRKYPQIKEEIEWAFEFVYNKRLLPSMRSIQFSGIAAEENNLRIFNCAATPCNRVRFFQEVLFALLCGTGIGYSVQYHHINQLPILKHIDENNVVHHTIADSIEGWADALGALLDSFIKGYYIEFSYHKIRDRGKILRTSGGRAPGHLGLKKALDKIRSILLDAQGRKLRPFECHRITCLAADAVLSGGIRRSSLLCLFSLDDDEMMACKTGDWYSQYPELANSNNSAVLLRNQVKKDDLRKIIKSTKQWGDPGFYFLNGDYFSNPCGETGLDPFLTINEDSINALEEWSKDTGKPIPKVKKGQVYTGISLCNLVEINADSFKTEEDFYNTAKAAAIINTCQAGYTDFQYLGWVTEVIARRERLLGVSMTGVMSCPNIALNPEYQTKAAQIVNKVNREISEKIGIRPGARNTLGKPSGTTTLELGLGAHGWHPEHARRYIRRVTANPVEPVFQYFKSINPHMCVRKPNGDYVIEFPVKAKDTAIVKEQLGAIEFLKIILESQKNWVIPGTNRPESSIGLTHNISNTIHVKEDEWDSVVDFIWDNKKDFAGIAMLSFTGDKDWPFAPNEAITTEADERRWNELIANYKPVDYSLMIEEEDNTNLTGEVSCQGGACAIT